ncbi:hypothetical protein EBR77_00680 [bacterium]|nr:hypothetical protein [bacterium]
MGILELVVVLVTIAGLFIWNRTESRADARHMDAKIDAIRELTHSIREEGRIFRQQWMEESKDFHNRLCEIERNRKK